MDAAVAGITEDEDNEGRPDGYRTASFLFKFGAVCLERSGLEWAQSMAGILQRLFNAPAWRQVLQTHMSESILKLKQVLWAAAKVRREVITLLFFLVVRGGKRCKKLLIFIVCFQSPELSSIFALFAIAGFPEVR